MLWPPLAVSLAVFLLPLLLMMLLLLSASVDQCRGCSFGMRWLPLAVSLKPELFEGLRFDFNKPLSPVFSLSHR